MNELETVTLTLIESARIGKRFVLYSKSLSIDFELQRLAWAVKVYEVRRLSQRIRIAILRYRSRNCSE